MGKHTLDNGAIALTANLTSPRVKLFHPGDQHDTTDPLQDWTTASVATDGTIYYDVSAALCDELGENYRALWEYTADGRTHYRDQLWHVTQTVFARTYSATDLDAEEPWIAQFTHITTAHKSDAIRTAQDDIWTLLKGGGRLPWLVFNQSDLNRVVHTRAMWKICAGQIKSEGDTWHVKASDYKERFDALWKAMPITYSADDDATPDETLAAGEIRVSRA